MKVSEGILSGKVQISYGFETLMAKGPGSSPSPLFSYLLPATQAAFFCCALAFAHRARCAAAIFFRAAWLMVRAGGDDFAPLAFAHRSLWAAAILSRSAADSVRFALFAPVWFP